MLALATLTVMTANSRPAAPADPDRDTQIALIIAEVGRLFNALVTVLTRERAVRELS